MEEWRRKGAHSLVEEWRRKGACCQGAWLPGQVQSRFVQCGQSEEEEGCHLVEEWKRWGEDQEEEELARSVERTCAPIYCCEK